MLSDLDTLVSFTSLFMYMLLTFEYLDYLVTDYTMGQIGCTFCLCVLQSETFNDGFVVSDDVEVLLGSLRQLKWMVPRQSQGPINKPFNLAKESGHVPIGGYLWQVLT